MLVKGFLITTFLIVLIITTIIFIAFTVIKRKKHKARNWYIFGAFSFFIFSIMTSSFLLVKTLEKGAYYGEKTIESGIEILVDVISPRFLMSNSKIQELISMQPADRNIPNEYYTYAGFRDYYRMPMVYPFSLTAIDDLQYGTIEDETDCKILISLENTKPIVSNIIRIAFDKNILIAEKSKPDNPASASEYILLYFNSGKIEHYQNEEDILHVVKNLGFSIDKSMQTIKEYHDSF